MKFFRKIANFANENISGNSSTCVKPPDYPIEAGRLSGVFVATKVRKDLSDFTK